jgi:penicillin-binding protein 2
LKENRIFTIQIIIFTVAFIYLIKLFYIQVIDKTYEKEAEQNAIQRVIEYPYRGVIEDRNGKLLVANTAVYDLMIIPKKVKINGDLFKLCRLLEIDTTNFFTRVRTAKKYSSVRASVFFEHMSEIKYGKIQDLLSDFPGFYVQARTNRNYPPSLASNALGYIGEISQERIELVGKDNYQSGDYIGISGLESKYEKELRGTRGVKYLLVNVKGEEKGRFKNGMYDTASVPGKDIISTLDLDLQKEAEQIMHNKVGSVVAIEPSTGEILAFVSAPFYDPNSLTGEHFSKNYRKLLLDSLKPLFNRALMAQYPPGSIFKTVCALYALQNNIITPSTIFPCNRGIIACHGKHTSADFRASIQYSCNPYYWNVYKKILNQGYSPNYFKDAKICYDDWRETVLKFGLGAKLGIDLPNEKKGIIPSSNYYDKVYGKFSWNFQTIYYLGIGQGEISITPIQMANMAAIFANRGYYYTPHLVKKIGNNDSTITEFKIKHETGLDTMYFRYVVEGMEAVVRSGTGFLARSKEVIACGKTGTVENPHGADHSVFIGFAPKDNPKIAVAVVVENSGFGAEWAAPAAGMLFAKYLNYKLEKDWIENYVVKRDFIHDPAKPKPKKHR